MTQDEARAREVVEAVYRSDSRRGPATPIRLLGRPRLAHGAGAGGRQGVEAVYRSDSRRVLATLIRLLGDFDLAEEAMHEAFATAVMRWPTEGMPANPRAWL